MSNELLNELGVMAMARSPEWKQQLSWTDAPKSTISGVSYATNNGIAVRTLLMLSPRERAHAHRSRVRITEVAAAEFEVTIDSDAFAETPGASDTAGDALDALAETINDGVDLSVSGVDLTFDADARTITRASGDWAAGGLTAGMHIRVVGSGDNDGEYPVLSVTTTVVTLEEGETLIDEGPDSGADAYRKTVQAYTEQRSANATETDTLVLQNLKGETDTHTTAVTAASGSIEFDEDATEFLARMWLLPGGIGSSRPSQLWCFPIGGNFDDIDYRGRIERVDTAGFKRGYVEAYSITNPSGDPDDAVVQIWQGPAVLESR